MKIAAPYDNGKVNQHFGRSSEFIIIEVENGGIKARKTVPATGLQHNHEGLAGLLKREKVDVLIAGGIGAMALKALEDSGLKVITGAKGGVDDVVGSFLKGELSMSGAACCHHHGAHGHGHNCHHN